MYHPRCLGSLLQSALESFPAILLSGARQTGKTTLLRHLLKKTHRYVLLDEPDKAAFAFEDPKGFLEAYPPPVIIDEIQNVPSLLKSIKARIEENPSRGQWVMTGSQQFSLMKNVSESLAGRGAVLNLHPFSLREITLSPCHSDFSLYLHSLFEQTKENIQSSFSVGEWLLNGGYPALFADKAPSRNLWFSSYVKTYLERDVRGNIREAHLYDFQRFFRYMAARTGQELNLAAASRELGISIPTVKSWLSLLEAGSLVILLPPYHAHFGKRIIKSPKLYFMDTGLVCYLVGLQTASHLLQSPMAGALFETAVVSNFKKILDTSGTVDCLYFWRAVSGVEVDLLIDMGGDLFPIEIKLSSTITPRHYSNLTAWRNLSSSKKNALVVSTSKEKGLIGSGVFHRPWYSL
jgi:predicted AAA+ superfamily ATPase